MLNTEGCNRTVVQCQAGMRIKLLKKTRICHGRENLFPSHTLETIRGNTLKYRTAMAYTGYSVQYLQLWAPLNTCLLSSISKISTPHHHIPFATKNFLTIYKKIKILCKKIKIHQKNPPP